MIEKYIQYRMFVDFKLPLIIVGAIITCIMFLLVVAWISDKWQKRQQKQIDKWFEDEEEETELE